MHVFDFLRIDASEDDSVTDANPSSNSLADLVTQIATQVEQARQHVRQAVNTAMVESYWQIGSMIVEHEQRGNSRAEYGQQQLSKQLTERLGKGFDVTNLRNMRRFYLAFPIQDAVRLELGWTHYRTLLRVDNPNARQWYLGVVSGNGI